MVSSLESAHRSIPLVSVAMVVCNVKRFLAEAIESILNQTFRDFEFIIVDFGSTDGTPSIVKRYQEKDKRIRFDVIPHCNLAEARSACCFRAQGKYLALLDADDVALPDRLKLQEEYLENHPDIGILGGANEIIDEGGRWLGTAGEQANDQEIRNALPKGSPFCASTVMMRFDEFRAVNGYRKAFAGTSGPGDHASYAEDYDLWLRVMERCRGAKLREAVARYRLHTGQVTSRKLRQISIGFCAAQASAAMRSRGKPDPLDAADSITADRLAELGVTEEKLTSTLLTFYRGRVLNTLRVDGGASILPIVNEMLDVLAHSKSVRSSVAAEAWFTAARAHWQQGNLTRWGAALTKAAVTDPAWAIRIPWRGIRRMARSVK